MLRIVKFRKKELEMQKLGFITYEVVNLKLIEKIACAHIESCQSYIGKQMLIIFFILVQAAKIPKSLRLT